jgi:hypothetical protein
MGLFKGGPWQGMQGGFVREAERVPWPEEVAPATPKPPAFFTGLDLGQTQDYSALGVVERQYRPDPANAEKTVRHFDVRHIHRWPLKTPYTEIVADVKAMYAEGQALHKSTLVIDETGVGRPVVDMFRAAKIAASLRPYSITGGDAITGCTVAKKHLVGAIQAPLASSRLRFAAELELTPVLVKELENFRAKVTLDRNEVFESWRERDHDDCVLSLALALWVANQGEVILVDVRM